jgi:hypothetical protein
LYSSAANIVCSNRRPNPVEHREAGVGIEDLRVRIGRRFEGRRFVFVEVS